MIKVDKELTREIERNEYNLKQVKAKIKIKKIIVKAIYIFFLINIILDSKGLISYINNNGIIFEIFLVLLVYINLSIAISYHLYVDQDLEQLNEKEEELEEEIEDITNFCLYLTSYRYLEAKKQGKTIYPELYESDCISIVKQYKDKYEEKRKEYEEQHKASNKI